MADQLETDEGVGAVDIVVPVYRAAEALDRCLGSVILLTSLPPHRLIVVIDGPQPGNVEEVFSRRLEERSDDIRLIRLPARAGFVAAVNRGMAESLRDVVLLNSDTEVTSGWLDKLQDAAYSAPNIATVTPLSNSATICSLPEFLEDNFLPAGVSADTMGAIVEQVSQRERPRLPTGVGVCLYIRRAALDAVGLFNETRFGIGYGEENEFCIRATAAGFEHIADDATFIFHRGQQSFGGDAVRRRRAAMRRLRSADSTYIPRVATFMKSDPMAPIRERCVAEIERRQGVALREASECPLSVLHIVHGWPPFDTGGTEVYARGLARWQAGRHRVAAFARIADDARATGQRAAYLDDGIRVRLVVNNFDRRNPIERNGLKDRRFERELDLFIGQTQPDLVHVHHLAGLCASLMSVVRRRRIPIIYQVQDWWPLCARANLWDADDTLCPGPRAGRCARCLPLTGLPPSGILNRMLYAGRAAYLKRQVRMADAYVMGSRTIREMYSRAGLFGRGSAVHVLEYGIPAAPAHPRRRNGADLPLTFGFIGALMPHKGAHVAVEAFRSLTPETARLVLWGNPEARPDYTARLADSEEPGVVEINGLFEEERKPEILASFDALIVPSVGLESFGIVAREALAAGVPVIASRRGALEELGIDGVCGATFAAGDPDDLRSVIDRLIDRPGILDAWRNAIPAIVTVEEHAEAVEEIYRQVMAHHEAR